MFSNRDGNSLTIGKNTKKRGTREFHGFPLICCRISTLLIDTVRDTSK